MYQHIPSRPNESTVRFSLVGCGRIAVKYVTFFSSGAALDACLVAVCDPDIERASAIVRGLDVRVFASPLDMMEQMGNSIDVIAILAPSGMHAELTVNLAKYGKTILVEKPMALTLVDADRMIDVCDSSAVKLFVVKQNRLNLPIRRLSEAIKSGRFGKLFMATSRIRWCRKQEYYDESLWSGSVNGDGGIFANQASHYLDLLQWMCGDVASVVAKTSKALLKIETEDTGIALLQFKNGAWVWWRQLQQRAPQTSRGLFRSLGKMAQWRSLDTPSTKYGHGTSLIQSLKMLKCRTIKAPKLPPPIRSATINI